MKVKSGTSKAGAAAAAVAAGLFFLTLALSGCTETLGPGIEKAASGTGELPTPVLQRAYPGFAIAPGPAVDPGPARGTAAGAGSVATTAGAAGPVIIRGSAAAPGESAGGQDQARAAEPLPIPLPEADGGCRYAGAGYGYGHGFPWGYPLGYLADLGGCSDPDPLPFFLAGAADGGVLPSHRRWTAQGNWSRFPGQPPTILRGCGIGCGRGNAAGNVVFIGRGQSTPGGPGLAAPVVDAGGVSVGATSGVLVVPPPRRSELTIAPPPASGGPGPSPPAAGPLVRRPGQLGLSPQPLAPMGIRQR